MTYTSLENQYQKYWIEVPKEWHENKIGIYHVSSIGCSSERLDPEDHSGPCLRETFYNYINFIDYDDTSKGNFHQGRLMHKEAQRIYRINHPASIDEFPLGKKITMNGVEVLLLGSIDIVEFTEDGKLNIIDFKSASNWTFPKTEDNKSPTHFNQVRIYAYWLQNFILNKKYQKIDKLKIIYLGKHNLYTGEQEEEYNKTKCMEAWLDFINRAIGLHFQFLGYNKSKSLDFLPNKEPHKWCKNCRYSQRCKDDKIFDENIKSYTLKEVEEIYRDKTGKSPKWKGEYSKKFINFKSTFKVIG